MLIPQSRADIQKSDIYQKQLNTEPSSYTARYNLAQALIKEKQISQAIAQIETLNRLNPRDPLLIKLKNQVDHPFSEDTLNVRPDEYIKVSIIVMILFFCIFLAMKKMPLWLQFSFYGLVAALTILCLSAKQNHWQKYQFIVTAEKSPKYTGIYSSESQGELLEKSLVIAKEIKNDRIKVGAHWIDKNQVTRIW